MSEDALIIVGTNLIDFRRTCSQQLKQTFHLALYKKPLLFLKCTTWWWNRWLPPSQSCTICNRASLLFSTHQHQHISVNNTSLDWKFLKNPNSGYLVHFILCCFFHSNYERSCCAYAFIHVNWLLLHRDRWWFVGYIFPAWVWSGHHQQSIIFQASLTVADWAASLWMDCSFVKGDL